MENQRKQPGKDKMNETYVNKDKTQSRNKADGNKRKKKSSSASRDARRREAAKRQRRAKQERRRRRQEELEAKLRASMLDQIPEKYIDFFPAAREIKREFVLHVGPTNSGKTYDAMKALRRAGDGVYLAPLRLLAFEQYEQMNADGYPCSLVTGEERYVVEDALFQASTIEMLNLQKYYSCAVIDEAQMIADNERGGSWTAAILGVCAEEVHVCMSPTALNLVIRMIKECGDHYRIVRHERKVPLICEKTDFVFPEDVQKGDALIVFSKRMVHAVAYELQKKNIPCSVIYGALPYDVRHEQARLFAQGVNDVVVATDAIGMGLNLPIRRVVFLEMIKFDGRVTRELHAEEIKQIAGRAGRFGQYETGYVSSLMLRDEIAEALEQRSRPLRFAAVGFPESLLDIPASLLQIIEKWEEVKMHAGYKKCDTKRMMRMCRAIRTISDDNHFLYDCLTIAFDDQNPTLYTIWKDMCHCEAEGRVFPIHMFLPSRSAIHSVHDDLDELEQMFKKLDLFYGYCDKFKHEEYIADIINRKNRISRAMISILAKQELKSRTCKRCGRRIPWNYPYGLCERCHRARRSW